MFSLQTFCFILVILIEIYSLHKLGSFGIFHPVCCRLYLYKSQDGFVVLFYCFYLFIFTSNIITFLNIAGMGIYKQTKTKKPKKHIPLTFY